MELVQTTDIRIEIDVAGDPWVTQEYGSTPTDSTDSLGQANGGHSNCVVPDKDTGQDTVQEWEDPVQPSQVKLELNTLVPASTSIVDSSSGCMHKGAKAIGEPGVQRQPLTSPECRVLHQMQPYVKTESSQGRKPHVHHMDCDGKYQHSVSGDISLGEQKPYAEKCVDVEEGGLPFVCEMCEACFQSQRQLHKHMSAHSQPAQNPLVKLETGCEVKPGVQFLPGTISEPEVKPCVPAVTNTIASVSGCMKKGVKLELCTHSWLFQHPPDKLEPEDKVEPGVQLGHGSSSDSTTVDNTVGCMYYGVKLEPDIMDKHCVKLEPGASSDSGVKLEPDISLKATSGIKTEQQHSENGLGSVDCAHNSDVNMYQCQSEVKPDTVILCDSNVEILDAANCNVHSSVAGFVSVPLYECDKPAAELSLAPHSDLMTASRSDLMTAPHGDLMTAVHSDLMTAPHSDLLTASRSDLMTAPHSDLMTAVFHSDLMMASHSDFMTASHSDFMTSLHSDFMTAAHSDLMTKVAESSGGGSSVCLGGEASSQEPRSDTVDYHRERENKIQCVCALCKTCFQSPRLLKQHMSAHTGQKPQIVATEQYTAVDSTVRGASFSQAGSLKIHKFTGEKPNKCKDCGARFTCARNLKVHVLTHTGQKPHKCTMCGASFSQAGSLKKHMCTHTGQKPHKCKACGESFSQAGSLKIHMCTQKGQKPHKCKECDASFSSPSKLKEHMLTHTGQKPHKCNNCDASFTNAVNLKKHMLTHTGQKPHKCTMCGASFSQAGGLKRHMFTHTGQKPHKCNECDASFSVADSLKRHMFTHTGQKPHKCTMCGASFSQAGNLKVHMLIHTRQKSHKCKECDTSFISPSKMKRHMLTYTGQKPHRCTMCGASFSQAGNLKVHMLTHTGQKPNEGKECNKSCTQAKNKKKHMLIAHTGQKPHQFLCPCKRFVCVYVCPI